MVSSCFSSKNEINEYVLQFLSQHEDEQGCASSLSATFWTNGTRAPWTNHHAYESILSLSSRLSNPSLPFEKLANSMFTFFPFIYIRKQPFKTFFSFLSKLNGLMWRDSISIFTYPLSSIELTEERQKCFRRLFPVVDERRKVNRVCKLLRWKRRFWQFDSLVVKRWDGSKSMVVGSRCSRSRSITSKGCT